MRLPRLALSLTLAVLAFALHALPAHADTYSITSIFSDEGYLFTGLTGSGAVVFDQPGDSACGGATCYYTILDGVSQGFSSIEPTLASDYNTVVCSAPPCSVTENGRTASLVFEPNHITEDLSVTSGSLPSQLVLQGHGFTGDLVIDASGDIIYDNGLSDEWYEAIDTTPAATPEPSSLLLLSTGALALLAFAFSRRRRTLTA